MMIMTSPPSLLLASIFLLLILLSSKTEVELTDIVKAAPRNFLAIDLIHSVLNFFQVPGIGNNLVPAHNIL